MKKVFPPTAFGSIVSLVIVSCFILSSLSYAAITAFPKSQTTSPKSIAPTMPVIPPKEKSASSSSQRSACIPTAEICDGLDNDCDGLSDDYACLTPGKFIAKFKDVPNLASPAALGSTGLSSVDQLNLQHGVTNLQRVFLMTGKTGGEPGLSRIYEFTVPVTSDIPAIVAAYQADEYIEYAEPIDPGVQLQSFPNDPYYWSVGTWEPGVQDQYWIHLIETSTAWPYADGTGITVAYTDLIKGDHPDLAGQLWINQGEIPGNAIDDDGNGYMDDYYGPCGNAWCHDPFDKGHGTHMAGVIAAETNNGQGMASVAFGSKLLALGGPSANVIKYAIDQGIKIITHSWSARGNVLEDLFEYAYDNGILLFVAAGNARVYTTSMGTLPTAIGIGAVLWTDEHTFFSGWGDGLDVAAPGAGILTTASNDGDFGDGFSVVGGTSYANPITASLGALLLSYNANLTPGQLRYIILSSVDDKGNPGWDPLYGHGRINVRKAFDIVRAGGTIPEWNYTSKITSPRFVQYITPQNIATGIVEVKGIADSPNFVNYQLDLCEPSRTDINGVDPEDGYALHNCRQIGSSTTPVVDGILGSFDVHEQGLADDSYYFLRLTVTDSVIPHYKPYITIFKTPYQTLKVPADYPTIQAAIDVALHSAIILVSPGTYTMTKDYDIQVIKSNITLKSTDGSTETIIDANGHDGVLFYSDNGTFQGFTIRNTPTNGTINLALTGSNITVRNNIFVSGGVGVIINTSQDINIINNTFYRPIQQAISVWGSDNLIAKNNILVGSSIGYGIWMPGGNSTLTYNNVLNFAQNYSPTLTPGVGSMSGDPLFVNPATGDYHLQDIVSPCIDAGDPADTHNEPWPHGNRINMGAYGGTSEAEASGLPVYTCGDADGSNGVDISDAVYLIQYIFAGGPVPQPYPAGDANGDNAVDISDAVYLIQYIFAGGPAPVCPMSKKIVQPSQDPAEGYTLDSFKEAYPQVFTQVDEAKPQTAATAAE